MDGLRRAVSPERRVISKRLKCSPGVRWAFTAEVFSHPVTEVFRPSSHPQGSLRAACKAGVDRHSPPGIAASSG